MDSAVQSTVFLAQQTPLAAKPQQSANAAKAEAADPLTGQRLPREYRDHARKYFDAIREGKIEAPKAGAEKQ